MSFNNGPRTVVTGLSLLVDAADPLSYPGSGTSWTDIVTGITGSLSGSITYASDFKGTLVVNNSSSVIIFPTSSGNFGSNSFTVELAFQPNQINGQHWLVAKNSGSFPSWGAFITGSSGSGRITAFFNVSSTISCSMSTPTGSIVTGSNYLVDINFSPGTTLNTIYLNSELSGSVIPNGGGSLTATSSLFISNRNSGSSVGAPLEIFNTKLYTPRLVPGMIRQNYNSLSTRLGLSQKISLPIIEEKLLNFYPGAAAAYSLRSLNSDYGGAAIQVRRSSDNAVANIGFTSNGDLDTIALLAHCGSGNGFVTEWFDQSGNGRNATQATALNQPQIVTNGTLDLENTKPTIKFDGINDSLSFSGTLLNTTSAHTNFILYRLRNGTAVDNMIMTLKTNSNDLLYFMGGTSLPSYHDFAIGISGGWTPFKYSGIAINQFKLLTDFYNGSGTSTDANFGRYANNILSTSTGTVSLNGSNTVNNNIGNWGTSFPTPVNVSELIIYSSNQSSNINGINNNIIANYGL